MWLENPMHIGTASVVWMHGKVVWCMRTSMIFVQVACNLVGKHCQRLVMTQFAGITVQNRLPVEGSITLWLIVYDMKAEPVCQKPSLLGSSPRIYSKSCGYNKWIISISALSTLSPYYLISDLCDLSNLWIQRYIYVYIYIYMI